MALSISLMMWISQQHCNLSGSCFLWLTADLCFTLLTKMYSYSWKQWWIVQQKNKMLEHHHSENYLEVTRSIKHQDHGAFLVFTSSAIEKIYSYILMMRISRMSSDVRVPFSLPHQLTLCMFLSTYLSLLQIMWILICQNRF